MRNDYLAKSYESLNIEMAVQLCCLEIRRFFSDLPQIALDKKSNFEYLERDVGLAKFLPKSVIQSNKPKAIRKLIQQHFKKYANYQERECMFKFFEILKTIYKFDQERFRCALGVRWISLLGHLGTNLRLQSQKRALKRFLHDNGHVFLSCTWKYGKKDLFWHFF